MRDGLRMAGVVAAAAAMAGCGVSEPLTCATIEAQGGVCGDTWDCVRLLDSPVLTETQDAGLVQLYLPGLQTCLDSSFHVYGSEGTTDDDIYAAFGEDKLAEARQACVDKCEQALSSTVLTDDEVKGMCATYVGDPYYHAWWLEVDGPAFESRPCRYEGNAQSAPPSSAPVSLVVSTPSGSAVASGWVRFTLPECTRSWCKVELERLDLTLDGPLRYAAPGGAVETIEEGTITLTSGASGTALVATGVTAGAECAATVAGAALGVYASPLIGDHSSGMGYLVATGFVRGGAAGLTVGTLGGGLLASFATHTDPYVVGGVSAGVGAVGLATSSAVEQWLGWPATGVAIAGTMVAVPVVAGITAAVGPRRPSARGVSLAASPTIGPDGGGVLLDGRF